MKKFGIGIVAGLVAVPATILTLWLALSVFAPSNVPAPAITRLVHLDEKLRFLRGHPEFDPTILAVGSSITWRQLDGAAFEGQAGGPDRFLNGATGYLRVHQTRTVAEFYLAHYPHVRTLIVMMAPPDFRDCTREPRTMFETVDAGRYVFGDWPVTYFYLRYFSPQRYLRVAMTMSGRKVPYTGDLYIDKYGSGPVTLPPGKTLGLRYGAIDTDVACADALVGLARDIRQQGRRLVLVFTPVHPDYRAKYPEQLRWLGRVVARMEQVHRGTPDSLTVLNLIRDPSFAADEFYDAFHLQWPAAQDMSARIAKALGARSRAIASYGRHATANRGGGSLTVR